MRIARRLRTIADSIRRYRLNSLFVRTYALILALVIIPLLVSSLAVYTSVRSLLERQVVSLQESNIARVRDVLDTLFREIDKLSIRLGSDRGIDDFISLRRGSRLTFEEITALQNVLQTLNTSTLDYVFSIYVYSARNDYVLASRAGSASLPLFYEGSWHAEYARRADGRAFSLPRDIPEGFQSASLRRVWSVFRPLPLNTAPSAGVVVINVDVAVLEGMVAGAGASGTEHITVFDAMGTPVLPGPEAARGVLVRLQARAASGSWQDASGARVAVAVCPYNGFRCVSVIRTDEFTRRLSLLRRLLLFFGAGSLLSAIMVSALISVRVYRPIREIMGLLEDPDQWARVAAVRAGTDEVGFIESNILRTFASTRRLREELEDSLRMAKAAQTVALQAQINPHFLFNTLQTINWMAIRLTGSDNEVSDSLVSLSRLLKLSLDSDSPIATLAREAEHARLYADMQKLRYKDKFDVVWDIDGDAERCRIVKILLQPLIENAIYHGIKPLEGRGTIAVSAHKRGRDLILRVQDDGVGMPAEAVAALNQNMESRFRETYAHIGLHNVNQRIKLLFGERFGIRVECGQEKGFAVEVTLPAVEEGT